jgi:tRNA nucleotidyltransferase (CCA-adding enzyme)
MNTWHLPGFRKHFGPRVWDEDNGKRFIQKHPESWVEADQWVTLIMREYQDAESLIKGTLTKSGIRNLRVGKHLKKKILDDYQLMDVRDLLIKGESEDELLKFLYCYLHKYELLSR